MKSYLISSKTHT